MVTLFTVLFFRRHVFFFTTFNFSDSANQSEIHSNLAEVGECNLPGSTLDEEQ